MMRYSAEKRTEYPEYFTEKMKRPLAVIAIGLAVGTGMAPGVANANRSPDVFSTPGHTLIIGGTNDGFATNMPSLGGDMDGRYNNGTVAPYGATAGPFVGDVPYDISVGDAAQSAAVVFADGQPHTGIGFSQGADAIGKGAEAAYAAGTLDDQNTKLILIGDPANPGAPGSATRGIAYSLPIIPGFETVKPRGDLGAAEITQPCLQYDPICNYNPNDPVNMALGYIAHTGQGPFTNYDTVDPANATVRRDGNTTFVTYNTPSPVEELFQPQPAAAPVVPIESTPPVVVASDPPEIVAAQNWVDTVAASTTFAVHEYAAAAVNTAPVYAPVIEQAAHDATAAVADLQQQATAALSGLFPR